MTLIEPTHADEIALLNEGIGSAYEYYIKRRYITSLIRLNNIKLILDVNHRSGITNSINVSNIVQTILLEGDYGKEPKKMMSSKTPLHSKFSLVKGDSLTLPFCSNTFDLVLNSRDFNLGNPVQSIRDMARVSKCFVLIFAPNRLHIGDLFFRLFLRLFKPKLVDKHIQSNTINNLCILCRRAGLRIFDKGGIDMPFWPSHFSIKGIVNKKGVQDQSFSRLLKVLYYQSKLEESIPKRIKASQAHVIYVLGKKIENNIQTNNLIKG